jgi:hypothetical protein
MTFGIRLAFFSTVALVAACATSFPKAKVVDAKLLTQASFDLSCGENAVEVVHLSTTTRGVSGCGKRASYLLKCEDPTPLGGHCPRPLWILNGAVQTTAAAPVAASPSATP